MTQLAAPPKPEIIHHLPFAAYCDLSAVNATTLLTYWRVSPQEARHVQLYDIEQTPSLVKGHATHAAILEPDVFEREYMTAPAFGNMRKKAVQEVRDKWNEEHKDSVVLTHEERESVIAMRKSVLEDPFISELFTGKGENEVTLTWTDEETGFACKARIDRLIENWHLYHVLLDIKTARDIDDGSLQKAIAAYHYHIRLGWYLDALGLVAPQSIKNFRVFIVWILNRAPWTARVTEFEDDDLKEGRLQYKRLLRLHMECVTAGKWPGYPAGVEPLGLPVWAFELHRPRGI